MTKMAEGFIKSFVYKIKYTKLP